MAKEPGEPKELSREAAELFEGLKQFQAQLEADDFEGKFWWDGHDEESGQEEWNKYTSSPEYKQMVEFSDKANKLGILADGAGLNIMVSRAVKGLIDLIEK